MRIGYACINKTLNNEGNFKTLKLNTSLKLSKDDFYIKIKNIILHNLNNTYKILQWNIENDILMYRCSSDLIPLMSHSFNDFEWWDDNDILFICNKIKKLINDNDLRVSFHPSQFNVLNSINPHTIQNTLNDLNMHNILANLLGVKTLILHIGSKTDGIEESLKRFIKGFSLLNDNLKSKLVLENDDKSFNVENTLKICKILKIPMCVDIHHDRCLESSQNIEFYMDDIFQTWNRNIPKCHLSSGRSHLKDRAHADYITNEDYEHALKITRGNWDIMCETKTKDLSIIEIKRRIICL